MKKLLILFLLIFLIGCSNINLKKDAFYEEYSIYQDYTNEDWDFFDYQEFVKYLEYKVYITRSYDEVKKMIDKKENFVIYYGFNPSFYKCPYCVASLPVAVSVALELKIDIQYLDIYAMRTSNSSEYLFIYNQLLDYFPDFGEKIFVPTYVAYVDGVPTKYHVGTLKVDGVSLKQFNEDQYNELYNIYKDIFTIK